MNKSLLLAKLVVISSVAMIGSAFADTQTLAVSATVDGKCTFTSVATTLSFGTVQPDTGPTVSGAPLVPVTYKCTKGVTPGTFSASNCDNYSGGSRRMAGPGGDFIPYTLSLGAAAAGTGFGSGQDKTISFTASIAVANYENASAGSYTDSVTLTVNP